MKNFKIFKHSFMIKLREILAYRMEFLTSFFGPIVINTLILSFLWSSILEYQGKEQMNGMSLQDFVFYYYLVSVLKRVILGAGVGYISRDIYYGELNKYLIYPINLQVFKWGTYFAPSFIYILQLLIFYIFYVTFYDPSLDFINLFKGCFLICISTFIYYLMMNLIEYLAFWFDNIWSLGVALRAFFEFCGGFFIPLSFFSDSLQNLFNFTPFPFLLYYPIQIMRGEEIPFALTDIILVDFFWILLFLLLNFIIWSKGRKVYTGVGI